MTFLVVCLLLFIIITYVFSISENDMKKEAKKIEKYLKQLQEEIAKKEKQLELTKNQINNNTIDRTTKLTKLQVEVLELYEQSNIKIPVEIIEDMEILPKEVSHSDLLAFIESQRQHWKLENNKKLFKIGG